jgi:glycosyltransferase 2 family protein
LQQKDTTSRDILRKLIPGLIFGFVVLLVLVLLSDFRQVGAQMATFDWRLYPLVLAFTLFNYALRFIKWHFYLGQIGVNKLPWQESLRLFVAGFPLAVTPGKVGEALKGVWLKQKTGMPVGRGISVVVAERISDGLAVLLLSTFGVAVFPQYWPGFLAVLLALIAVVVISQVRPLALWLLVQGEKITLIKRMIPGLRDFYEGSFALFRPGATLLAVALGTISWLGEGIGFYLILLGLGLEPGLRLMALAVFVLSFSAVVGAASALPGGLGAAEASIAGLLLLVIGDRAAAASTATLLIRLATLWFGVCIGLATWLVSPGLFLTRDYGDARLEN